MELNEIIKKLFNERLINTSTICCTYSQTQQIDEHGKEFTLYYDINHCTEQDIIRYINQCKYYTNKFTNNQKFDY